MRCYKQRLTLSKTVAAAKKAKTPQFAGLENLA
jgi:hypothetical protein